MTHAEEWKYCLKGARQTAAEINEPVVIIESDVLHEYEQKLNWIARRARWTLYSDNHKEFWQIIATVYPNGTYKRTKKEVTK